MYFFEFGFLCLIFRNNCLQPVAVFLTDRIQNHYAGKTLSPHAQNSICL